jgi:signal transduction histidine kinase
MADSVARKEFPGAVVVAPDTLDEALRTKAPPGLELLVLADPDASNIAKASGAIDATGLPRWAVAVLGNDTDETAAAAAEKWNEDLLALLLRSAVVEHELRRDNFRMRGDLRTIAHRVMHDLRTPLGGILNTSQALREVLVEQNPAGAELAKPIIDSVRHMSRLMDRVSLLARASASSPLIGAVAMDNVVARVMQRFERQVLRTGAVVSKPGTWPRVEGVADWLEIAWSELMANALQYGGEAPQVELGWDESDAGCRFWVLNRRGSVPPEKLHNLFQPFHLLHQLNAKRGLGLSIVQRLLELQNGTCGCERLPEDGAIFFFTLPKPGGPAPAKDTRPAASDSAPAGQLTPTTTGQTVGHTYA